LLIIEESASALRSLVDRDVVVDALVVVVNGNGQSLLGDILKK
jgi:ABC-type phosphate transport system substrate-binding protein